MAEYVFRKTQYGKENPAAHGTAVAATRLFTGQISVPVDRKPQFAELMTGRRARAQEGTVHQIHVDGLTLSMEQGVFQMLPMIFSMALKGAITAAEQTTGQADYLWDFTPSLTASNAPDSMTIEYGDDVEQYEIEYVMCKRVTLKGSVGDDAPVNVEAECFGKQITVSDFTGSIAVPTVDLMSANMVKIYIDDTWANLGTTEVTDLLQEFSIEILTGLHAKFHAEGVKTMTGHGEGYIDAMLTLTYEGSSAADTQFDLFRAGTARAIRIEILGDQIGTGDPHSCVIDVFGEYESVIPLGGEKNGNNLHTAIFHALDDNTGATPHMLAVKVTTDRNAV